MHGGMKGVLPPMEPFRHDLNAWEQAETVERMLRHGFDEVRGWEFTTTESLTADNLVMIKILIFGKHNACRQCGNKGHFARECGARAEKAKWLVKINHRIEELRAPRRGIYSPRRGIYSKSTSCDRTSAATSSRMSLYEQLHAFRSRARQTRASGPVPAYCVFSDKLLDALVENPPQSSAALLRMKGWGKAKVNEYGDGVLELCKGKRGSGGSGGGSSGGGGGGGASSSSSSSGQPAPQRTHPTIVSSGGGGGGGRSSSVRAEFTTAERRAEEQRARSSASKPIDVASLSTTQRSIAQRVLRRGENLFLTGPAGTGKSYLFSYITQELLRAHPAADDVAVTAPTGVAAVNVGGQTIHSWAGVGLGRGSVDSLIARVGKSGKASRRWKNAKVLLIDEISMLDSSLFDALALIGAAVREVNAPFGGLQLILCGDFYQLPPVGLNPEGGKSFAFDSLAWRLANVVTVKLTEVMRQKSDQLFIPILNEIREGELSAATVRALATCHVSRKARPTDGILPTRLYCKNRDVDKENTARLASLAAAPQIFDAAGTDVYKGDAASNARTRQTVCDYAEKKVPRRLVLKLGAQVVLLRNLDQRAQLVNGSRGVVVRFEQSRGGEKEKGGYGAVECKGALLPVIRFDCGVERRIGLYEVWVGRGALGSLTRRQLPLKLAWALTVHKSQGMSLSRVEVNVGDAFDFGQVYVALSRAESRGGLWLSGPAIENRVVKAHPLVKEFYRKST